MARRTLLAVVVLTLLGSLAHAADEALWRELDIIPMPKEIALTGRDLPLAGAVVVLGPQPSAQDTIGAQWLSDECVAHGGAPLPVVTADQAADAPLRIIVGTRASNPLIAAAAEAGQIDVGPGNPGERGYVIATRPAGDATELLLAGADEIGALYACVTLGELCREGADGPTVREATVRDWPDFIDMTLGAGYTGDMGGADVGQLFVDARNAADPSPELRAAFLSKMHEHYDRLLRWKVSSLWINLYETSPPAGRALVREAIEYGKQRGIGALYYAMEPFAGRVADYPDYTGPRLPPGRYPEWIRCWSLDEMRRETAEKFARFVADVGYTDVGFHDTDTGGFINPAQWEERCAVCRERWGDDYAAATINKFMIWYEALKRYAPEARMHIVIYPYSLGICTEEGALRYVESEFGPGPGAAEAARRLRERYQTFWRRITEGLPRDINVCIREEQPENVAAFRDLIGDRGIFIFFKLLADPWTAFFSESPRWTGTFYRDRRDFLFPPTLETYVPVQALAVREYAWNTNAPGAEPFDRLPVEEQWRHCEPGGPVYEIVLPHVVRNFFGRRFADQITGALARNVNPYEIFESKLYGGNPSYLTSYERWQWQADEATAGAELLDEVWAARAGPDDELGMTHYAFMRFVYLREIFHCCRWWATARAAEERARKLARAGDLPGAEAALAEARQAVEEGRADAERLLAERPADEIYAAEDAKRRGRRIVFRLFTPDAEVDWGVPLQRIEQTRLELPALAAAGEIDERILARLDGSRLVHIGRRGGELTLDGRLDEPDWRAVYPAESFFVYQAGRKIADAPTQMRLLCDDQAVYLGISCWLPGGGEPRATVTERDGPVLQDDAVEVFLAPPALQGGYVHLALNALGTLRDQLCSAQPDAAGVVKISRDPAWNAAGIEVAAARAEGRWDLEVRVPLSDLGDAMPEGRWGVNLAREYHSPAGTGELSSIMPSDAADFHDRARFRRAEFTAPGFAAPGPEVELSAAGFATRTETLDDRIATVCRFGVHLAASRVLHEVTISAEAYGPDGRLHRRVTLAQPQIVLYEWAPTDAFEIAFDEVIEAGAVRLTLHSDEAEAERWVRFSGWAGAGDAGALLSPEGASGGALAGDCALASRVFAAGAEEPVDLLAPRAGTVEFWFRPQWAGRSLPLSDAFDMWRSRPCLLHFGPLRADNPYLANHSSLTISLVSPNRLYATVADPSYANWQVTADLEAIGGVAPEVWHHLALVWDGDAQRADWLRLYLDGRRISGEVTVGKEERFGDDPSLRVPTAKPYTIQLGCMTSGRSPARALIDELRISRGARYSADFAPERAPAQLDADASLVLHFDADLRGTARAVDGREVPVEAVAGVPEYH